MLVKRIGIIAAFLVFAYVSWVAYGYLFGPGGGAIRYGALVLWSLLFLAGAKLAAPHFRSRQFVCK